MNLKLFTLTLLVSCLLSPCQPARTRTGPVVIDRNKLQNFADAFFAEQMKTLHIPGVEPPLDLPSGWRICLLNEPSG